MSCYHPLIRIEDLTKWTRAADGHKYHPAKVIKQDELNDLDVLQKYDEAMHYKKQVLPCGKCIGCRLDYSQEWANRCYLESKLYEQNYFVTLTIDDEHLTYNDEITDKDGITWVNDGNFKATLSREELDTFIDTLRAILRRNYKHTGLRFLACGEYGNENLRPHYHLILLNCPLPKESFYNPRIKESHVYYQNRIIERAWTKGISNICVANWQTTAYVTRYITKKVNGPAETDVYYMNGIIKEFFIMSRSTELGGIGKPYYDLHKDEIYKTDSVIIKTASGVVERKPPKYFDKLYEEEYPEKWKEIKWRRENESKNASLAKSQETSLFLRDQLAIEERSKEDQASTLKRNLEKSHKASQ